MLNRYRLEAVIGWQRHGVWLRAAVLPVGVLAALAMIVVGCNAVTQGGATIDHADAPLYRASVTASEENSVSSSSARESERQVTLSREAVHASCDALSSTSVDAIDAVNSYIDAFNAQSADAAVKAGPAIDALHRTADTVAASLSASLSPELAGALKDWVAAARAVAGTIADDAGMNEFNAATHRMNDVKRVALKLCDASY